MPDDLLTQVQVNVGELNSALRHNNEFFIHFNLQDQATYDVDPFQIELMDLMMRSEISQLVIAIPREHAKTTIAKLAVLKHFLYTDYDFIIYVSNTHAIAANACKDIVGFMQEENFMQIFGRVEFTTQRQEEGTYDFRIGKKRCILKALGAGQQIRGLNVGNRRPQMAIVDDLEDNTNTATKSLQDKLRKWFYGPFYKALEKARKRIIHIGNLIATTCLLSDHLKSPFWQSVRLGAILSDGTPLWKSKYTIQELREEYRQYQHEGLTHVWLAEMMNIPVPGGGSIVDLSMVDYRPMVFPSDEFNMGCITVDPAISEKTWADKFAVVAHAYIPDYDQWMPVEFEHKRATEDPMEIINIAVEMCCRWGFSLIGVESGSFQTVLQYYFKHYLLQNDIQGIEVVGIPAFGSKSARIAAWGKFLAEKDGCLPEGDTEFTEQFARFDQQKRDNDDDLIDAGCMIVYMIAEYGGLMTTYSAKTMVLRAVTRTGSSAPI